MGAAARELVQDTGAAILLLTYFYGGRVMTLIGCGLAPLQMIENQMNDPSNLSDISDNKPGELSYIHSFDGWIYKP